MTATGTKAIKGEDLVAAIRLACRGLVYISETDAEIMPFFLSAAGQPLSAMIERLDAEYGGKRKNSDFEIFFAGLTREQPWHTQKQKLNVKKFRSLQVLLQSNLENLRVYRYGRISIDILVIGQDADNNLAGIKTKAVET